MCNTRKTNENFFFYRYAVSENKGKFLLVRRIRETKGKRFTDVQYRQEKEEFFYRCAVEKQRKSIFNLRLRYLRVRS